MHSALVYKVRMKKGHMSCVKSAAASLEYKLLRLSSFDKGILVMTIMTNQFKLVMILCLVYP